MRQDRCGTFGLSEGHPDAGEVARFRAFLADVDSRGLVAVAADPKWSAYIGRELAPAGAPAGELGDLVTVTTAEGGGYLAGYPDATGEVWRGCEHTPHTTRLAALMCAEGRLRLDARGAGGGE